MQDIPFSVFPKVHGILDISVKMMAVFIGTGLA